MTENNTEAEKVDPDVQAALEAENKILSEQMEQFKSQHFQNRLIAVSAVNRRLVRENEELKNRLAELEISE